MTFKDLLEDEREEGRAEGLLIKAREMAKSLLQQGVAISVIATASGLSESEIKSL